MKPGLVSSASGRRPAPQLPSPTGHATTAIVAICVDAKRLTQTALQPPTHRRRRAMALFLWLLLLCAMAITSCARDTQAPRASRIVMLVIDTSGSMHATDVRPDRLAAAQNAAKQFTDELPPGIELGLVGFNKTATLLASPTTDRARVKTAIDTLKASGATATGSAILSALEAIAAARGVASTSMTLAPANIVLLSDGTETIPDSPDDPKGAFTAARIARNRNVPIWTIAFGTPGGCCLEELGQRYVVPVSDETLKKVAELSGGSVYTASSLKELNDVYSELKKQIGFNTSRDDTTINWPRVGGLTLVLALAAVAAVLLGRHLPT